MSTGKVVLVLSGGGARAAAQIGVMQALLAGGIAPTNFVGTSMGAVIAAMFASGMPPDEAILRVGGLENRDVVHASRLSLLRGLWSRKILEEAPLRAAIKRLVPAERFSDLRYRLTVTATDIDSGGLMCFGEGGAEAPLQDALYASCALPLFYPPANIGVRRFADGGLRAVLPLQVAAWFEPGLVVAVDVGPGFDETLPPDAPSFPPVVETHNNTTRILMANQTAQAISLWKLTPDRPPLVYIRPPAERGATFRLDLIRRYVEEGREAALKALSGLIPS